MPGPGPLPCFPHTCELPGGSLHAPLCRLQRGFGSVPPLFRLCHRPLQILRRHLRRLRLQLLQLGLLRLQAILLVL